MALIELSTALVAAGSSIVVPFVNKSLEKTATRMGEGLDAHLKSLFTKAHDLLAATGREARAVEPKLMVPLIQAARLETDETLINKWAALLANAADSAQRAQVQPGFADVLRQLTPTDALVFDTLYTAAGAAFDANQPHAISPYEVGQNLGLDNIAIELGIDNLLRLRLCKAVPTYGDGDAAQSFTMPNGLLMTLFGWQLRAACMPPAL